MSRMRQPLSRLKAPQNGPSSRSSPTDKQAFPDDTPLVVTSSSLRVYAFRAIINDG